MIIKTKNDLVDYFHKGIKEKKNLKIGVENEKFLFDKNTNKRATYIKLSQVLHFLKKFGWKEVKEKENIIGLKRNGKTISLEPGNQIELSGAKLKSIHETCQESYEFLKELKEACLVKDLKMMSLGFDPITKIENVPNNPKQRYKIMTEEMPKQGELSLNMMYQTCGTQINLDYCSENDFKIKFKLISFLTPVAIALFANSSIKEMKISNYLSYRSRIWQSTSRGGLPKLFLENMDFEKYVDMSINMPLLFILQKNKYLQSKGKTFKDFMDGKITEVGNSLPSTKDFNTHLATIFTEVRLKRYIEIRSLDACEWDCHCAGPAFYTGLIYGNLEKTYNIINHWDKSDVLNAYKEAPKKGLHTIIDNKTILEWGKIFLNLSKEGLEKRNYKNNVGKDETIFLKNIESILNNSKTKAELAIEKLKASKKIEFLYD